MQRLGHYFSRRTFLQLVGGVASTCYLLPGVLLAKDQDAIKKTIPSTGERIPVIGMGTSRTFDAAGDTALISRLEEVLQAFFDHGGALIDSSPMYGSAEQVVGQLLKTTQNRGALFSATKVWSDGMQAGIEQMEHSRQLWGIERFDLMQIHNLRDWKTHLKTLKTMKEKGKVRYIGFTTSHGRFHDELASILSNETFDFVQFSYNIMNRTVEQRLLPLAEEKGIAVIVNRPYARGDLFRHVKGETLPHWASEIDCKSWGQFFLKYVVSHPAVTCVIPATSKVHHMIDNMGAGFGRLPDEALRKRMYDYIASL